MNTNDTKYPNNFTAEQIVPFVRLGYDAGSKSTGQTWDQLPASQKEQLIERAVNTRADLPISNR